MKLARFVTADGDRRLGIVGETGLVDLGGDRTLPRSLEEFLDQGDVAWDRAKRMSESEAVIPFDDLRLCAPLSRPRKYLAIASNYQSHIDEVKRKNAAYEPPVFQRWFNKQTSCINDPYAPIVMPHEGDDLDYEVELALVISRRCARVTAKEAPDYVAGYMICNDVSVRNWQKRSPTITLGKSFDTHGPIGPWLVTPDEIGDPHALRLTCSVNGEIRQDGNTSEMLHNCYQQIAYLSEAFTLEAGDILATGTPSGTGAGMTPPGLLKVGDVVRCEIEKIGAIEAKVIDR